ncbi:MAG: hypothetical protein WHS86_11845 [Desulfosoma sp.]
MADWVTRLGRVPVDGQTLKQLSDAGLLVADTRRTRPLWFDGRFLTARDLQREQTYFMTRQADLSGAVGYGVVRGLWVYPGSKATNLRVEKGFGIASGGERIVLAQDVDVDLGNLPSLDHINRMLGFSKTPAPPWRTLSGLFVLAARAVEFTANPTGAYPTRLGEERRVEDGEIVEAVLLTLIPYDVGENTENPALRRAAAAHDIFVKGTGYAAPPSALPLAMVELDRGFVRWVDVPMVRQDMGSAESDVLGLGMAPRPVRAAHFQQARRMFQDIADARRSAGQPAAFAASDHFLSLPPAGLLPAAALDAKTLTQTFFPPAVQVDLSIIPEDELPCLVEESFLLPPIDLTAPEEALAATSVLVCIPLPRNKFRQAAAELETLETPLPSANTARKSRASYLALLHETTRTTETPAAVSLTAGSRWASLIAQQSVLWYVRRRNLNYRDDVVGAKVPVLADEFRDERAMRAYLKEKGLADKYTRLKVRASAEADLVMASLLTSRKFRESETLLKAVVRELEQVKRLDAGAAREIMRRYDDENLGEGLRLVEETLLEPETRPDGSVDPEARRRNDGIRKKLAEAQVVPEIDQLMRRLKPEEQEKFMRELTRMVVDTAVKPQAIAEYVRKVMRSVES